MGRKKEKNFYERKAEEREDQLYLSRFKTISRDIQLDVMSIPFSIFRSQSEVLASEEKRTLNESIQAAPSIKKSGRL